MNHRACAHESRRTEGSTTTHHRSAQPLSADPSHGDRSGPAVRPASGMTWRRMRLVSLPTWRSLRPACLSGRRERSISSGRVLFLPPAAARTGRTLVVARRCGFVAGTATSAHAVYLDATAAAIGAGALVAAPLAVGADGLCRSRRGRVTRRRSVLTFGNLGALTRTPPSTPRSRGGRRSHAGVASYSTCGICRSRASSARGRWASWRARRAGWSPGARGEAPDGVAGRPAAGAGGGVGTGSSTCWWRRP